MIVRLTKAEQERLLWWLHRPVPPGPQRDLDIALIRKLSRDPARSCGNERSTDA